MADVKPYYLYILASRRNGTLYIGVTSYLIKRVYEHKVGLIEGFSKKYNVKNLIYYEEFGSAEQAVLREKRMKKWKREWKVNLIEANNPHWVDLYTELAIAA